MKISNAPQTTYQNTDFLPGKRLQNHQNARTAGFMPAWVETGAALPEQNVQKLPDQTLTYKPALAQTQGQESFGFSDLLDMVNPLQHLPVVGYVYREFTGDTIRPIGQIIGGALFGGPLGAAGGVVSAIIQEETGKEGVDSAFASMFTRENDPPLLSSQDEISQLLALTDLKSSEHIQVIRYPDHLWGEG